MSVCATMSTKRPLPAAPTSTRAARSVVIVLPSRSRSRQRQRRRRSHARTASEAEQGGVVVGEAKASTL
jgi:hypothetical protein